MGNGCRVGVQVLTPNPSPEASGEGNEEVSKSFPLSSVEAMAEGGEEKRFLTSYPLPSPTAWERGWG